MDVKEYRAKLNAVGAVDYEHFESYKERFKEFFVLKRENGIIEARMHLNGGEAGWCYGIHNGWSKLVQAISQGPENEVLIITGTGDKWIAPITNATAGVAFEYMQQDPVGYARSMYDDWYCDGQQLLVDFINSINIPTIGVINGPAPGHTEFALACDLCLAATDANFVEPHFSAGPGFTPGDGQYLAFQHLIGTRKANYMAYTGLNVDAETAKEWGLVDEVLPREKLLDRAWEIARMMMTKDRLVRRLTHDIARQPWKHALDELKFSQQFALECWSAGLSTYENIVKATSTLMDKPKGE